MRGATRYTWFEKDKETLVTYEFGGNGTVIDYILVRRVKKVKSVKSILEQAMRQHRLLVMNILSVKASRKQKGESK